MYPQQTPPATVKAPGFGDNCKSILGDIGVLTNRAVFNDELDIKLDKATPDLFGTTDSVTITKEDTIILNGAGSKDVINQRCEEIRALMDESTTSEYEKEKLHERLARLSGGVAVIKVGSASEGRNCPWWRRGSAQSAQGARTIETSQI